jgi:Tfp pilus assembly protein PilP
MKTLLATLAALLLPAHAAHAMQPVDPLEHYDYRDLYLARTVPGRAGGSACFITSDGKTVWVRTGEYVGMNFGRVVKIADRYIVVAEQRETDLGDWVLNRVRIPVGARDEMKGDTRCADAPPPPRALRCTGI